jgi:lipid-binding SYLF domain-containing protein
MRTLSVLSLLLLVIATPLEAASRAEIDRDVAQALAEFRKFAPKAQATMNKARGVLVFPKVVKAGIGIGGEYGEGALRVGGRTVGYYSVASGSIGLQLGAQARSQVVMFMTDQALKDFRASDGWKAGVDGSIALATLGAGGEVMTPDSTKQAPVLAFVFGAKGLMYNLSLEGSKFTKLKR